MHDNELHPTDQPTEQIDLGWSKRHYAPTLTMRVPVQRARLAVRWRVALVLLVAVLAVLGLADLAWYGVTGLPILGML